MEKPTKPISFATFRGQQGADSFPFQVHVKKFNRVVLLPHAYLLENFDIRNKVPIFGLLCPFDLYYRDKVYLEIRFDNKLNPVVARVRHDTDWVDSTTIRNLAGGGTEDATTYPNEIELISLADVDAKGFAIDGDIASAQSEAQGASSEVAELLSKKAISEKTANQYTEYINKSLDEYLVQMYKLRDNMSKFFSGSVASKKQLRHFKLIAYTTKDMDGDLAGTFVRPPPEMTDQPSFKLVQCARTDFMIVDCCFRNVGCKVPVPWTRPVYEYTDDNGVVEDIESSGE